ncbi:MAG: tetratricopeptide repeat protein, partial [Puniceicoccales bacterium]
TWLSYALNYTADGLHPRGYIAVNLLLHAVNAALVFLLITCLLPDGGRRGLYWAVAGALFYALHPLRVESVVWVTERRDVLALFFLLLSLLAWLRSQQTSGRHGLFYALSLIAFALSLLSKAWGIVYPAVLFILCLYPLQQRALGKIIVRLLPFALLALGAALLAAWAQSEQAMATLAEHGVAARLAQAIWSPAFYLGQTAWPLNLSPLYLLPKDFSPWSASMLAGAAVTLAITALLIARARHVPGLLAGWLIFLVLLAPVSGLAQSGPQLAADRYTYLAGIVLAVGVTAAGRFAARRWPEQQKLHAVAMAMALAVLAMLTVRQCTVWENAETLWGRAISADADNYVAYFNRAQQADHANTPDRLQDLNRAIELDPGYAQAYALRGELNLNAGHTAEARTDLDHAIELDASQAQAWNNRGVLRLNNGDKSGAREDFTAALERDPSLYEAHINRGLLRQQDGDRAGALADYDAAIALNPNVWQIYYNRGLLRAQQDQTEAAIEDFTRVIQLNPVFPGTYRERAVLYNKTGQAAAAQQDLATARRLTQKP